MVKILISCGELSGDEYGGDLARTLYNEIPGLKVRAMGGQNLASAGAELVIDSEKSASVMGFAELFGSFGKVFKALSIMKKCLSDWRPDLLIVIDYPEFNMRLSKYAKKIGIPVIYYIAPKVWAWRSGRVKQLARDTEKVITIFPFEVPFLHERGCTQAVFLGNPLIERYKKWRTKWQGREAFLSELGLSSDKPILTIFPGSRQGEIERHLDTIISALKVFSSRNPDFQLLLNVAPSINEAKITEKIPKNLNLKVVKCDSYSILSSSDIGLLKSGTSNLQAAVAGLPFVMFYKATSISAFIIKRVVKLTQYSLVNILKPDTIKELTQEAANPENIAKEIEALWANESERVRMKAQFVDLIKELEIDSNQSVPERISQEIREYFIKRNNSS